MMRSTKSRKTAPCRDWHDLPKTQSCQNDMLKNGGKPVFFVLVATGTTGTTVFYNTRRALAW